MMDGLEAPEGDGTKRTKDLLALEASLRGASRHDWDFEPTWQAEGEELAFKIPCGREGVALRVDSEMYSEVSGTGFDIANWRALPALLGVFNPESGVILIALEPQHRIMGRHVHYRALREILEWEDGEGASPGGKRFSLGHGKYLHLGQKGSEGEFLLGGMQAAEGSNLFLRLRRRRSRQLDPGGRVRVFRDIQLRLDGFQLQGCEDAEKKAQMMADTVSYQIARQTGIALIPIKRERLKERDRRLRRPREGFEIKAYQYEHAGVAQYMAGLDDSLNPLVRFWSFYQVLETFFGVFMQKEVLLRVAQEMKKPGFSAHNDQDVMDVVRIASGVVGGAPERDSLKACIKAVETPEDMAELIESLSLDQLATAPQKGGLSARLVRVSEGRISLDDLADRIYDIRCRIVHSGGGVGRTEESLFPGHHLEGAVEAELPIIQRLAEGCLDGTSAPLH